MNESFERTSSFNLRSDEKVVLNIDPIEGWNFEGDQNLKLKGSSSQLTIDLKNNILPNQLNIKASALMDISILEKLLPNLELAQGQLIFASNVRGSLDNPQFTVRC